MHSMNHTISDDVRTVEPITNDAMTNAVRRADHSRLAEVREKIESTRDLQGLDFSNIDFREVGKYCLEDKDLTGACLRGSNLCGMRFHKTVLTDADLQGVNLQNAEFEDCHFNQNGFSQR